MIVKGTTKSGIKYQLDSRIVKDARLVLYLTAAQDTEDPMKASKALMDLLSFIFGSQEGVMAFMNEVANKHKGTCLPKDLITEINDMFEGLNVKNS